MLARLKPAQLFLPRYREPVLEQQDAGADHHLLQFRRLAHELEIVVRLAEAHHPLDSGPVVPGPVEQHDLSARRQVLDIALEVPLALLALGRLVQRHHARAARVEVLGEPLDGAALAGSVPALEQHDDLLAGLLHPLLHLQQFDLQLRLVLLVVLAADLGLVRILAVLEHPADLVRVLPALRQRGLGRLLR